MPTEGNVYNKATNAAFGNGSYEEEPAQNRRQLDVMGISPPAGLPAAQHIELLADKDLLLADIEKHI